MTTLWGMTGGLNKHAADFCEGERIRIWLKNAF